MMDAAAVGAGGARPDPLGGWARPRAALPAIAVLAAVLRAGGVDAQPAAPDLLGNVSPTSHVVGCDRADQRITVAAPTHLDPSCTYTKGIDIIASDVVLDCRGAVIERADPEDRNRLGILIEAPANVPLSNVVVRNCTVRGFNNNLRIRRNGAKDLPEGLEYEHPFSRIRIEHSRFYDSDASGVFVDAFVTGVTIRHVEVAGSDAVGIYLEAGSRDNVIARSSIRDNGYGVIDPAGIPIVVGGVTFRYLHTGREGIAVDGSRANRIVGNRIGGNAAGGIFLYKNCGEDLTNRPAQWWPRRYGADRNRIVRNVISDEPNGVWIGSRMAENLYFMDCSDPAYVSTPIVRIHEDFARDTLVRRNRFVNVTYAVRVEDDGSRIEGNRFVSDDPAHQAVVVGTQERTRALGRPVLDAAIRWNRAEIAGNANPYSWIHGHEGTILRGNRSDGVLVPALVPGVQPPIDPFIFAREIWVDP